MSAPVPKWMCCCYSDPCECRWCSHCGAAYFGFHACPDRAAFLGSLDHDMLMKEAVRRSKNWRSRLAWHLVVHLDWTDIPRIKVASQP